MTPDIEVSHSPEHPQTYASGAKRSGALPKYRLIPAVALRIEAEAFAEGSEKYERAADGTKTPITSNWRRGNLDFFLDASDHLSAHVAQFNNLLLELMLDYQNPALEGDGEHFDTAKARLLEELGHARANTAFLAEWLDSGAAGVQIVEEVVRLENAEATLLPTSDPQPTEEQLWERVYGRALQNAGATAHNPAGAQATSPEDLEARAIAELPGTVNAMSPVAGPEGLLPRSFRDMIGKALGR